MNSQLEGKRELLRNNLSKMFQAGTLELMEELFSDSEVTEDKAIELANAISNINAPSIRLYGYNIPWVINLITDSGSDITLKDTGGVEKQYYIKGQFPIIVKAKEDFAPQLSNGEYIYISCGDNQNGGNKIYKSISKDEIIANFGSGAYLQLQKQNFGNDLIFADPYNFTFDNQTTEDISFFMYAQYAGGPVSGNSAIVDVYTNWDYVYPYWSVDLTNSSKNVVLELWKADMSQRIYSQTAQAGNDYSGNNYLGQARFSNYSTRDYKVIAKYQ